MAGCIGCRVSSASHSLSGSPNDSIAPLYYLIRRPTHVLDFALTLGFNHLILTTYYAKAFPTSFYFWVVLVLGSILMIVVAEQVSCGSLVADGSSASNAR